MGIVLGLEANKPLSRWQGLFRSCFSKKNVDNGFLTREIKPREKDANGQATKTT